MGDSWLALNWTLTRRWLVGVLLLLTGFPAGFRKFAKFGRLLAGVLSYNIFSHFFNKISHAVLVGKGSLFRVIATLTG